MAVILGIESSCDESACAIVRDGYEVVSSRVASQIAKHALHGGVVPELAAREHLTALKRVLDETLSDAKMTMDDIDAIAVTQGPGLMPALLVGFNFAKGLALGHNKKLIGTNHFIAHIYGAFLEDGKSVIEDKKHYPMLALVVSGGHTSLMLLDEAGKARHLGWTIDDAAGEALDKGAKLLDLGYPGGPIMQKTGEGGDIEKYHFPRPLTGTSGKALSEENRFNFSFSGIKTALLYHVQREKEAGKTFEGELLADTVASYQEAVIDVLVRKTLSAAKQFNVGSIVVAGGVACNKPLRERFTAKTPANILLKMAKPVHCTDNAAMVAGLGYHYWKKGMFTEINADAFARLPEISEVPFIGD